MASMASNLLLLNAILFHATRLRDTIIAQGHAMPIDLKHPTIGDTGICVFESGPVFVNAGISVPISRGSPPSLIR
jgi:hypothetical protein